MQSGTDIYPTLCEKSVFRNNKQKNNFRVSISCNGEVTPVLAMPKQWEQTKRKYERRKSYTTYQKYENSLLKVCVESPVRGVRYKLL